MPKHVRAALGAIALYTQIAAPGAVHAQPAAAARAQPIAPGAVHAQPAAAARAQPTAPAIVHAQPAAPVLSQTTAPTRADYERALGLRDRWQQLTANVADAPVWVAGTSRFHYRRTTVGGHEFVVVDAETLEKRAAFDHARVAAALAAATDSTHDAARLPFDAFRYIDGERGIAVTVGDRAFECALDAGTCTARPPQSRGGGGGRPMAGGVVRDLEAPFDDSPRRSPDGRWDAYVRDHDLYVRPVDGVARRLTDDGAADDFFDHATITWSPDSRHVALYRVLPGERRLVHYVNAAPADRLQPTYFSVLYPKPGDVIDRERPVLFEVETGRRMDVPTDLFPNPYRLSGLSWRRDGRAVTFEYNERGHRVFRVIEVDARPASARAVIDEATGTFFNYPNASGGLRSSGTYYRRDVDDGREVLWMSERDGWRHLYLYDGATGRVKNQVTRGEFVVRGVLHVDVAARRIWFTRRRHEPRPGPVLRPLLPRRLRRLEPVALTTRTRITPSRSRPTCGIRRQLLARRPADRARAAPDRGRFARRRDRARRHAARSRPPAGARRRSSPRRAATA
jgi:hypothetical protein